MGRKTINVTITDDNRDRGRTYVITEMSASQGEKWAARAMFALVKSGVDVPETVRGAGLAGIAFIGLQTMMNVKFEDIEPLMDEMFQCVQIMPDAKNQMFIRPLVENDIEEVTTRFKLRQEVLNLHLGFLKAGNPLTSILGTPATSG